MQNEFNEKLPTILTGDMPEITDTIQAGLAWSYIANMKRKINKLEIEMKEKVIEFMKNNKLESFELGKKIKILLTNKKYNRYATTEIFELLKFTEEQIKVLPKNPTWKKTEVLLNDKISHCHYEDEKDELILKELDEKFIEMAKKRMKLIEKNK